MQENDKDKEDNHDRELKKEERKQFMVFFFKFKKTSCLGCTKEIKLKANAWKEKFELLTYEEKDKKPINEKLYLMLDTKIILTVSLFQFKLEDKNSLIFAYYNTKGKLTNLRLFCENRFECERYCVRLKELYSKDTKFLAERYRPKDGSVLISECSIVSNGVTANPKTFYYYLRYLEDLIEGKKLQLAGEAFLAFKAIND